MRRFLVLWTLAALAAAAGSEPPRGGLVEAWNHFLQDTETALDNMLQRNEAGEGSCAECEEQARLQALRVQSVQNQILRKLRLRARPSLERGAALPAPVAQGRALLGLTLERAHRAEDLHSDDFYGKTEQKIVFPDDVARAGKCGGRHPTACFSFTMPKDLQPQDVSSAELWIYKEPDSLDGFKQTFVVTEAAHWDYSRLHTKTRPVAIAETDLREGWLKAEVGWAVGLWLEEGRSALAVACPSCGAHPSRSPLALAGAKRPFLVINTRHSAKKRRVRQLECTEGVSECCRERLYVSFAELGWDDWILHPRGYHAYFCRGACSSVAAVTLSGSHHHSVIKKLFHSGGSRRLELKPCCTPTTFSAMPLLYRDSNFSITQTTLPNMIVESCGCM